MKTVQQPDQGFTLTEMMIVVGVVALLAVIAIPNMIKSRHQSQDARYIGDLRVGVAAFEMYATETGGYPADMMPAQVPSGMSPYFGTKLKWTETTPVGGNWDWDNGQFGFKAGVSVYRPDRTDSQMTAIDEKLDDGDLNTGIFRKRSQGYIYIIEN